MSFLTLNEKRAAVGYAPLDEPPPEPATEDDTSIVVRKYPVEGGRKYRPDQARAPAGTSDGGEWVDEGRGGSTGGGSGSDRSNEGSGSDDAHVTDKVQVAGGGRALMKELLKRLMRPKTDKLPEFLVRKPGKGKIIGKLDDVTADERQFYEEMRDLGNNVEIVPRGVGRTPDVKLNGRSHELKTIKNVRRTEPDRLSGTISSRILDARGQAADVIINARDQAGMTKGIAVRAIHRAFKADNKKGINSITILTPEGPVSIPRKPQ